MSATTAILLPPAILIIGACALALASVIVRKRLICDLIGIATIAAAGCSLSTVPNPFQSVASPISPVTSSPFAMAFSWSCLCLGTLFLTFGGNSIRQPVGYETRAALMFVGLAGAMLVGSSNDLIVLFLGLELTTVSAYFLNHSPNSNTTSLEAAAKMWLPGVLSSAVFLFGICLIFGLAGSTNLSIVRSVFQESYAPTDAEFTVGDASRLGIAAIVLVVAGLGTRLGVVPFHLGVLDVSEATTFWNVGFSAVVVKGTAFVALIQIVNGTLIGFEATSQLVLIVVSAATMVVGSLLAVSQTNLRRMLVCTFIAHGGFALIGIAAACWESVNSSVGGGLATSFPTALTAAIFHLSGSLVMTTGLVSVFAYLSKPDRQVEHLEDLAGLVRSQPVAAVCAVILLLGLAGLPPLWGFWSRLWLLAAALSVHAESGRLPLTLPHPGFVMLAVVAVLSLLLIAIVYLRIIIAMLFDEQRERHRPVARRTALSAAVITAGLTVLIGISPGPFLGFISHIAESLEPETQNRISRTESTSTKTFHVKR